MEKSLALPLEFYLTLRRLINYTGATKRGFRFYLHDDN